MILFNDETSRIEMIGWLVAILNIFVLPSLIFLYIRHVKPNMENKWGLSFLLGWIPGNIVSCYYLGLSCGFGDAFMIFIVCEIMQLLFIHAMTESLVKMFGERAFK